jgi:hypothetical protein
VDLVLEVPLHGHHAQHFGGGVSEIHFAGGARST